MFLLLVFALASTVFCEEETANASANVSANVSVSFKVRRALFETMPDLVATRIGEGYNSSVVKPLYRLYRHGPSLGGFGFWRSQESADICAALTKIEASHWRENEQRCEKHIYGDFRSYLVLLETCVYFFLLVVAVRALASLLLWRCKTWSTRSAGAAGREQQNDELSSPTRLLRAIAALLLRTAPHNNTAEPRYYEKEDDPPSPYAPYAERSTAHHDSKRSSRDTPRLVQHMPARRIQTRSLTASQRSAASK